MATVSQSDAALLETEVAVEHRPPDSLAEMRDDARRERLLDMQVRLRPYRTACFAILALALASASSEVGWWWVVPLGAGFAGFMVADHFMRSSSHPSLWAATAWGILPFLLADAVLTTGGGASPVLMWFALPAVTLGARFSPRGMVIGTAYILALLLGSTYGLDHASASAHHKDVVAAVALVLSTVILSGALVESDRAHRRRSTLDPLTGLFNRNALEQRLAELDGQPSNEEEGQAVRRRRPVGVAVTVSVGVAVSRPDAVDTDDLVARADAALYEAKAGGRDAVVIGA